VPAAARAEGGEARRHECRLGVFGQRELALRAFEHESRELLLERLVHLLEDEAGGGEGGVELAAHADRLGTLSGKDERACHQDPLELPTLPARGPGQHS
jgi:hypothetical protein